MDMAYRNFEQLKKETNRGRNTRYTTGVLCHACLPHGFGINLRFSLTMEANTVVVIK